MDDLHDVYLGVGKNLMEFWFGVQHKNEPYSIRSQASHPSIHKMM